jgi:hypothetical protein
MKKILLIICLIFFVIITSYSQLPSYVPSNGLISWYSFNGNANDLSGNGHNGTLKSNSSVNYRKDRHGFPNKAFVYNQNSLSHSYVKIPWHSSFSTIRTVSFWLTSDVYGQQYGSLGAGVIQIDHYFHISLQGGSVFYKFKITNNNPTSRNTNFQTYNSGWHNYVVVFNDSTDSVKFYVDAVMIDSMGFNNNLQISGEYYDSIYFGYIPGYYEPQNVDTIDDIGLWNRSLTPIEILNLYNSVNKDTITLCSNELPYSYYNGDTILHTIWNSGSYFLIDTITPYQSNYGTFPIKTQLKVYVDSAYLYGTDTLHIKDSLLPYTYGDSVLTQGGNFDIYFTTINGCDSLINLQLYVNPTYDVKDTLTVCDNELPYTYGDSVLTQGGNFDIYFKSIDNYDSLVKLQLYINPTYHIDTNITICDIELPFVYEDSTFTEEGQYGIHFTTINGCDSVIKLQLYINPTYHIDTIITICDIELPFSYGDSTFTEEGQYDIHFQSINSCGSTTTITLYVKTPPSTPLKIYGDNIINTTGNYIYYVENDSSAEYYTWYIDNIDWVGNSSTESIEVYISNSGSGKITVNSANMCGKSDTISINIFSTVNISEINKISCELYQNTPNPSSSQTKISYVIQECGNVIFKVLTVNGQIIYEKKIQSNSGLSYIDLNTEFLSSGIYYYIIEYKDQRLIRKMNIQK